MQVQEVKTKSHTTRNIVIAAVVIVILAFIALSMLSSGASPLAPPAPTPVTTNIVNGLLTVNAGHYESYQITVPAGATSVQITGTFTASGGSGNDIIVIIMDSTNFVNWENGHQASAYYNSGQVTTGSISTSLPDGSGTYYLVYSNAFSVFSNKNVNTQANLIYTPSS